MRRSYIICPYCGKETALQGIDMHTKSRHPEKYAEYKKNYDTLKKTAIRKEINTKQPPTSEPAAPKPVVAAAPPKRMQRIPIKHSTVLAAPAAPTDPGGEAPPSNQGADENSFLEEVADGVLKWINSP